jgi:hypothetical protein
MQAFSLPADLTLRLYLERAHLVQVGADWYASTTFCSFGVKVPSGFGMM